MSDAQAGDAYKEAALVAGKIKNSGGEAAQHWNNAGQCYKKIPQLDGMKYTS